MYNELLSMYNDVTEKLNIEETHIHKAVLAQDKNFSIAFYALLCLRIAVNAKMISNGSEKKETQLKEDLDILLEETKKYRGESNLNDNIIFNIFDIILTLNSSLKNILYKNLENKIYSKLRRNHSIEEIEYKLFIDIADYYEENHMKQLAYLLYEQICNLSRQRNSLAIHRKTVLNIIIHLGERAADITCKIAGLYKDLFENIISDDSGIFFWYYGCALQKNKNVPMAAIFLKKSYEIRRMLYGEDNWLTAISNREYNYILFTTSKNEDSLKNLLQFIDNIDMGLYHYIDREILDMVEGKTLAIILMSTILSNDFADYEWYLCRYEEICNAYDDSSEPILKLSLAYNLRGIYYMNCEDYIQAEVCFINSLKAIESENNTDVINITQIKSNLLTVYYIENDMDKAYPLLYELLILIGDEENESGLQSADEYRICALWTNIETEYSEDFNKESVEIIKRMLDETCLEIQQGELKNEVYAKEAAVFTISAVQLLTQCDCINIEEKSKYIDIIYEIEKDYIAYSFDKNQMAFLYLVFTSLMWETNSSKLNNYIKKDISIINNTNIPMKTRAVLCQYIALYYDYLKEYDLAISYVERTLSELTAIWQSYVKYLNDKKLLNVLVSAQFLFLDSYYIVRTTFNIEYTYEKLLQFKMLASLAGKERNRVLNKTNVNKDLFFEIQKQQDKIAYMESNNIFRNTADEFKEEKNKLTILEAEFAKKFPKFIRFTDITLNKLYDALPNNSIVIEYFLCRVSEKKEELDLECEKGIAIDIYIIRKENNKCCINKTTVLNVLDVIELADEFIEMLQNESINNATIEQINKKDKIRHILYKNIIKPVLPYIDGIEQLYIAPDNSFTNLPFELLYDEEKESLENMHNIIKIECGRDFMFDNSDCSSQNRSLIIGNPEYEVGENELGKTKKSDNNDYNRLADIRLNSIKRLPFSELEIRYISHYSNSRYYSGLNATKELLLSAEGYRNIHIATHGFFDRNNESETIYSSSLMFAGVKNWLITGEISEFYGNGIITADEISRMNLKSTELVVLSSCLSGMNDSYVNKGFHGMIGALSAAGVHYVISHLWAANDFSTAVLMDEFYRQYNELNEMPPMALKKARNYLKNVTISKLMKKGWFEKIKNLDLDINTKNLIAKYEKSDGKYKPFKNEAFWGGFVCYRCN